MLRPLAGAGGPLEQQILAPVPGATLRDIGPEGGALDLERAPMAMQVSASRFGSQGSHGRTR